MFDIYDLQMFAIPVDRSGLNTNVTYQQSTNSSDTDTYSAGNDMTTEIKQYYDTELLENARKDLYFAQFGRKQPLPKGKGNSVEWRKWNTFPKAMTPLVEGVNPTGQRFGATQISASCTQHGMFTAISDRLELQAIDDVILGATEEMGASAGETMDTLIRNALSLSLNNYFAPHISSGSEVETTALSGIDTTAVLTPKLVNKIVTQLKKAKAPKINGDYIAIIHPSCAYDLRQSAEWMEVHKYASPGEIYNGEIGKLHGVRFIEDDNILVTLNGASYTVGAGADAVTHYCAVYHNLFFGQDAYGIVDPEGAGLEMIVHDKASGGTSNPLNLYSTIGYKFTYGCRVLYPERIVEVCCGSDFSKTDEANADGLSSTSTDANYIGNA